MRKLDQRGVAAFEFCLVAVVFFTLVFAIFDLGRYAITMQSLRHLAGAGARAMMIQCYTPAVISNNSPSGCTGDYLSSTQKQDVAPFLYAGGLSPTVATTSGGGMLTVTASQPGFAMMMPIWGTSLNAPQASTQVPFSP
ncbi:TadE/TadG family type IV pilus assembly protein [Bradyrhizobium arachidis]|uniref:TadE/TadG family type IV pilus assembly protein n=1 Tax=Bradyrhizobium arachidis TaxID=858423 RepID=UPI002163B6B4|nr:TadE family protein [Bradyrhizobium arachidis]